MHITSLQNAQVKQAVRLRDSARQRRSDRLMLVEGWEEIRLALAGGATPRAVYCAPELVARTDRDAAPRMERVTTVDAAVFRKMSYRERPDGWLAVFPVAERRLADLALPPSPLVVVAETVEKPGNLGAILRTADAAGVDAVILCDAQTDLTHPNVVHVSRGAVFTVQTAQAPSEEVDAWLRARRIRILATDPEAACGFTQVDMNGPLAIVVGSEHEGLSEQWLAHADVRASIPMVGRINSLNVSVAAALVVYEALRQRRVG